MAVSNKEIIVVDTETLDTSPSAVVLTVSAVRVSLDTGLSLPVNDGVLNEVGENILHIMPNVTEQLLSGRTTSAGTIAWWNGQSNQAKQSVLSGSTMLLADALALLTAFIGDAQVFCRGTDFDPPILASLYKSAGLKAPWKYNQVRDVRTFIDALSGGTKGYLENWEQPSWLVPHHSLHDCIRDAMQMVEVSKGQCVTVPMD
ncbi:3'-5' exoribonuclease [Pseudoalteromonas sp. SCSIO 43201]|uniref:3'-5' exonuclease n=1 Tax=Pseudoalteromonas sp. SCSIO 43201 TaxID=2822842 RepID=UPI0020750253|nr:3'-5' exonuclease [Pseudoalteromonas sp. SCSIO 43201]USD30908.1 3'-5' exoribonuclease [Pseudoalteromonas sp. SCSIO 43201]